MSWHWARACGNGRGGGGGGKKLNPVGGRKWKRVSCSVRFHFVCRRDVITIRAAVYLNMTGRPRVIGMERVSKIASKQYYRGYAKATRRHNNVFKRSGFCWENAIVKIFRTYCWWTLFALPLWKPVWINFRWLLFPAYVYRRPWLDIFVYKHLKTRGRTSLWNFFRYHNIIYPRLIIIPFYYYYIDVLYNNIIIILPSYFDINYSTTCRFEISGRFLSYFLHTKQ